MECAKPQSRQDSHCSLMKQYDALLSETCQYYGFSETPKLRRLYNRKNIQLTLFAGSLRKWEQLSIEKYQGRHQLEIHKDLIQDIMREYFVPRIAKAYNVGITDYYLLNPVIEGSNVCAFSIKVFEKSLFREAGAHHIALEERMGGSISKYIKDLNGRGPEQVHVALMDEMFLVFVIRGLISPVMVHAGTDAEVYGVVVENIIHKLIAECVYRACEAEFEPPAELFVEVDFSNNQVVALAVMEKMEEMLRCTEG